MSLLKVVVLCCYRVRSLFRGCGCSCGVLLLGVVVECYYRGCCAAVVYVFVVYGSLGVLLCVLLLCVIVCCRVLFNVVVCCCIVLCSFVLNGPDMQRFWVALLL